MTTSPSINPRHRVIDALDILGVPIVILARIIIVKLLQLAAGNGKTEVTAQIGPAFVNVELHIRLLCYHVAQDVN